MNRVHCAQEQPFEPGDLPHPHAAALPFGFIHRSSTLPFGFDLRRHSGPEATCTSFLIVVLMLLSLCIAIRVVSEPEVEGVQKEAGRNDEEDAVALSPGETEDGHEAAGYGQN
jgi:hypothetical protein